MLPHTPHYPNLSLRDHGKGQRSMPFLFPADSLHIWLRLSLPVVILVVGLSDGPGSCCLVFFEWTKLATTHTHTLRHTGLEQWCPTSCL